MKSAPRIGLETSATVNRHFIDFVSPSETLTVRNPKVFMVVLFAAYSVRVEDCRRSSSFGGITEMSAPLSTRNVKVVSGSKMKRRCGLRSLI